jgi:hypothetical protein
MLECIKVITADIDVLAIDILWFLVMLFIGHNDGGRLHACKHAGIALAEELETLALGYQVHFIGNHSLEFCYIELPFVIETLGKVPVQQFYFTAIGHNVSVSFVYVCYHRFVDYF